MYNDLKAHWNLRTPTLVRTETFLAVQCHTTYWLDSSGSPIRKLRFRTDPGVPPHLGRVRFSGRMLVSTLPLLSGSFQLAVALCVELPPLSHQHIPRHVARGSVQLLAICASSRFFQLNRSRPKIGS